MQENVLSVDRKKGREIRKKDLKRAADFVLVQIEVDTFCCLHASKEEKRIRAACCLCLVSERHAAAFPPSRINDEYIPFHSSFSFSPLSFVASSIDLPREGVEGWEASCLLPEICF